MLPLYAIAGLTGLHGFLVAKNALEERRRTQFGQRRLVVELTCAALLGLACCIMLLSALLNKASFISFFAGWLVAAIGTLPLPVTGIVTVIKAVRQKQSVGRNIVKLLLNCLALLIYLMLSLWMGSLLLIALSGEPYMGN